MRIATIASLGASALLGLGALFVAKVWLPSNHAGPGKAEAAPAVSLTAIVAAKSPIAYGQKIEAKDLTLIKVPADSAPQGAFTSIDAVIDKTEGGPVALASMAPREALLPTKVTGPGARATLSATIAEGMRAYTIKVNDVAGGGGHVLPGDRVDVILSRQLAASGEDVEGAPADKQFVSSLVLQNVRVLGMDMVADPEATDKFKPSTATLEVTVLDAGKLAVAGQSGTLSLALRRVGAVETTQFPPVTLRDVAGGPPPRRAAARPRSGGSAPAAPRATRGIVITQGDQKTVVSVPTERLGG